MSGEDMVRALGYIDERYIEEAENTRFSTRGIWLRVGSAAACLCILLAVIHGFRQPPAEAQGEISRGPAGGAAILHDATEVISESTTSGHTYGEAKRDELPESACAGMELNPYAVSIREIRTDGGSENTSYPFVTILRSCEELEDYCLAQGEIFDLESGFLDACSQYNESYFAKNDLILVCVEEESGSVTHQVIDVYEEEGVWNITVVRHQPEEKTDDMAQWHILVEIQMGKVIAPEETVTVRLETKEN